MECTKRFAARQLCIGFKRASSLAVVVAWGTPQNRLGKRSFSLLKKEFFTLDFCGLPGMLLIIKDRFF
jgi:hypothetical protein